MRRWGAADVRKCPILGLGSFCTFLIGALKFQPGKELRSCCDLRIAHMSRWRTAWLGGASGFRLRIVQSHVETVVNGIEAGPIWARFGTVERSKS